MPFKKIRKKSEKNWRGGAVAADQVQGGLGHGEIEEGQKKKNPKKMAEVLLRYIRGFFLLVAAKPRQPATVTAAATTATAATATRWVDRFGLATRYYTYVHGFFFSLKKKPTGQHMFPRIFSPSEVLDKNQGSASG